MKSARQKPLRALVVTLALVLPLLAAAKPASGAVVINEVESDGATGDFVELINAGGATVDISEYVIKDNDDSHAFTIPPGTTLPAGGYYVANISLAFGLGANDSARLFVPADPLTPVDSFTWTSHAAETYGRCPDGTGAMTSTVSPTAGAANDCPTTPGTPVTPPVTPLATSPAPTPDTKLEGSVTAQKIQEQKGRKIAVKATVIGTEAMAARATGKVEVGKVSYALKPLTKSVAAGGSATLKLKPAKAADARDIADALADGKKGNAKLTVELTDVVGNRRIKTLSVKLKEPSR